MSTRPAKAKTLGDVVAEVRELKERAAVHMAVVGILRTRYLPRDSMPAQAHIACDGAPVSERVLDEIAAEIEEQAKEMVQQADATLSEAV